MSSVFEKKLESGSTSKFSWKSAVHLWTLLVIEFGELERFKNIVKQQNESAKILIFFAQNFSQNEPTAAYVGKIDSCRQLDDQ